MFLKGKFEFTPLQLVDLANYCYDRQQSTPLNERNVNNFLMWIADWIKETKADRAARNNEYLANPEKRTPEYHRQLSELAERIGLLNGKS